MKFFLSALLVVVFGTAVSAQVAGEFEVRFDFDGTGLTAGQQAAVQSALDESANFWESVIVGYQPGVNGAGIDIDVSALSIDGASGALAQAGPSGFLINSQGFTFAGINPLGPIDIISQGDIEIDIDDLGNPLLQTVINHEVGHALGFGTLLFEENDLATDSPGLGTPGQYTGAAGLAAYQDEFDSSATFIPLEDAGGPGTANGHLDENIITNAAGEIIGIGPTGITDQFGRDLADELLTGVISSNAFLSNTTVATFEDLGFSVVLPNAVAVPEPASAMVLAFVLGGLGMSRRRS